MRNPLVLKPASIIFAAIFKLFSFFSVHLTSGSFCDILFMSGETSLFFRLNARGCARLAGFFLYLIIPQNPQKVNSFRQLFENNSRKVFDSFSTKPCSKVFCYAPRKSFCYAPRNQSEKLIPPPRAGKQKQKCDPDEVGGARDGKNKHQKGGGGGGCRREGDSPKEKSLSCF